MNKSHWQLARIRFFMLLIICFSACAVKPTPIIPEPATIRAGLRSSPYGPRNGFPAPPYWLNAACSMASRFENAVPSLVWIVGTMESLNENSTNETFSGRVQLSFPAPGKDLFPDIVFAKQDANEAFLEQFDKNGVKVWLQVEPANADVGTLIDLVLNRYGKHPCVIGFGVDVEWFRWSKENNEGVAIDDALAMSWSERARVHNPKYLVFLKHWLESKMPPNYRQNLVFISDSQQFTSLAQMQSDFEQWGKTFSPAPVGFQFGYPADRIWWKQLVDPPGDIGKILLSAIPNISDLIWVDFTMEEIWPPVVAAQDRQ